MTAEEIKTILKEKPSLEKEYLEILLAADTLDLTTSMIQNSMVMSIAHSLAVIADAIGERN